MKAFIGIIINMGLVQMQDMKDYWSRHETANIQFFHHVMSRDRFFQIFNMLHVGNRNAQSRTEKIQPFLELGIHIYADQPRAHKVCIISLESEHIKLTCIDNL